MAVEYPLPAGASWLGSPGAGTHSFGDPPNNWESDEAIDLGTPIGTPVYAVESGTIGQQFGSLGDSGRFEGLRLHLETGGDEFYYAHLSRYASGIHPGTEVSKGQLLGYSGSASGVAHLHFAEEAGYPTSGESAPVVRYGGNATGFPYHSAGGSSPPASPAPSIDPNTGLVVNPTNPATSSGSSSTGGGGVRNTICDADCLVCDRLPGPAFLKRINPLCISCQACRDANNIAHGGGDVVDAITSVPKALSFILSYRFLEVVGGGLLVLLGIYLLGKQLGVDVPVPSPAVAAVAAA